ncbi:MAG: efflux RND transporter periplasmic adaptor subunit [bacterium]
MNQRHNSKIMFFTAILAAGIMALAMNACVFERGATSADEHTVDTHGKTAGSAESEHQHGSEPVLAHNAAAATTNSAETSKSEAEDHASEPGEHADEVVLTPEAVISNGIKLEPVRRHALNESFTVPARVSYNLEQMAHVGSPVPGRVTKLLVKQGDEVKNGGVLAVLESPALGEAQGDYLQKKTQLQTAQSAAEVAQSAAERAKRLLDANGGMSLGECQKREGEYKTALGLLRSAEAALTSTRNKLSLWGMEPAKLELLEQSGMVDPLYTLRAPIDGCVIERKITLGEIATPERDALMVIAGMKTLWTLADVPENKIHKVELNSTATVTIDAMDGRTFPGKVTHIAPALDNATRTAQARVEVEDGHSALKPGMFAHVTLNATKGQTTTTLAVPESALQSFEGGAVVFVAVDGEPGAFVSQPVKTGQPIGSMVPILSGLEEGKQVVTSGTFIVKAELAKGIMEGKTCSGH